MYRLLLRKLVKVVVHFEEQLAHVDVGHLVNNHLLVLRGGRVPVLVGPPEPPTSKVSTIARKCKKDSVLH